jgi:hypothetical protein
MEKYPDDWPCTCGHLKKDHGFAPMVLGAGECAILDPKNQGWCIDDCLRFKPIDNLTYVEQLADARRA